MAMKKDTHRQERAKKMLAGRKSGGKVDMMKSTGKKRNGLSGAAPTVFPAEGLSPRKRQDKRKRYATGGGVDGDIPKKKSGAKTEVNIVIAGKGDQATPQPVPIPVPASPPPGAAMPPRPPMAPPGAGMPPMGMRPPGAMRRGGGIKQNPSYPIEDGAGGGKGRLEKAAASKRDRKGKKSAGD